MYNSALFVLLCSSLAVAQPKINYLAEGFDDNRNNWTIANTNDYRFKIEDGHYMVDAYTTAVHAVQDAGLSKDDSFGLHTRMIFFNGTSEGWMGVRFGVSTDASKYLTFCFNNAQGFLISTNNGKKYEVLRQSKSTVVKPYEYNTLTVVKAGTTYKFLINDKQVFKDEIKSFYGPKISLYASENMSIRIDQVQLFDPRRGKQTIIASQATMAKTTEEDIKNLLLKEENMPADFKEFYDFFTKFAMPYDYSTVINQATLINDLPFVQKHFYQYDLSSAQNHNVYALAILSVCQDGYTFLVGSQVTHQNQESLTIRIVAFDNKGKRLGSKDVGATVKENGQLYQSLHFRVSKSGASITFQVEEKYYNGNVNKKLVSYNGELCNLNSY